ncbi:hypothetical protein NE237_009442 [Protea cynaroides]|uniref:Uncharacterized protein n=1 Tax=Protea cynaroides TaxID=273540 RepID=A0A9Q0KXR2_9MAGN|nr:hypothetical protein NE237_009442 [Protea cynaroides]
MKKLLFNAENLQYHTGSGYQAGAIVWGAKGSIKGIKYAEAGDTLKLSINRVLNSGGEIGRSVVAELGTGALCKAASGHVLLLFPRQLEVWPQELQLQPSRDSKDMFPFR